MEDKADESKVTRQIAAAIVAFGMVFAVVSYAIRGYGAWVTPPQSLEDGFCDKQPAPTTAQRFVIDIRQGGRFTYTQAKFVDVAWDLLIGQGGRFLHAWILCRYVVSEALVWTMERSSVPYQYYINLSCSTISFWSLSSLLRVWGRRAGRRTFITVLRLAYAIIHVLIFPTIWSAATSYISLGWTQEEQHSDTVLTMPTSETVETFDNL